MLLVAFLTTWWFWISLVAVVALIICEANESSVFATITVLAALLMYQFFGDVNILGYVKSNPLSVVEWCLAYLGVGTIWGTFKWWLFALNERDTYIKEREDFLKYYKVEGDKIPLGLKDKWLDKMAHRLDFPPKVRRNKSRITRWMAYWPTSVLWTLMDDFVKRVYTTIYNLISSTLQRISDSVFAKTIENEWDEE